MAFKPAVKVEVGEAFGMQGLPGCTVRSTHNKQTMPIKAGDNWHFTFPDPDTKLYIEVLHHALAVTITNQTSVPLTITTKINRDELTDILGANKRMHLADGARVTVEA